MLKISVNTDCKVSMRVSFLCPFSQFLDLQSIFTEISQLTAAIVHVQENQESTAQNSN